MPETLTRDEALKSIGHFFGDLGGNGPERRGFIVSMLAGVYTSTFSEGSLKVSLSSLASTAVEAALSPRKSANLPKLFIALKAYPDLITDLVKMPGFLDFIEQLRKHKITIKKEGAPLLERIISNPAFFKDVYTIVSHPNPKEAISLLKNDPRSLESYAPPENILKFIDLMANPKTADLIIKLLGEAQSFTAYSQYFKEIESVIKLTLELKKAQKSLAELEKVAITAPSPNIYQQIDEKNQEINALQHSIYTTKKGIKRLILSNQRDLAELGSALSEYSNYFTDVLAPLGKLGDASKIVLKIMNQAAVAVELEGGDIIAAFLVQMLRTVDVGSKRDATTEQMADRAAVIALLGNVADLKDILYAELATDPTMLKNRKKFALSGVTLEKLVTALESVIKDKSGALHALIENQELSPVISMAVLDDREVAAAMHIAKDAGIFRVIDSGSRLLTNKSIYGLLSVARQLNQVGTTPNRIKTGLLLKALSVAYFGGNLHDCFKFQSTELSIEQQNVLPELAALRSLERCDLTGLSFAELTIDNFTIMHSSVNCDFRNSVITNTSFDNSGIHSDFTGATIKKCSFEGAIITAGSLATLSGATIDADSFKSLIAAARRSKIEQIIIPAVKITGNLSGADLTNINFIETDFRNVYSMEGADIGNCIFSANCSLSDSIIKEIDKLSRSHSVDGTPMKVVLPHHFFAELLDADLSGLGAKHEADVRFALQSTTAASVLNPVGRGVNTTQSKGLETASSVILDDYSRSIENGNLNIDAFVKRTLSTRLASKIADNLFSDGKGRQGEVLELQTKLYDHLKDSNIDFKKLLDGSEESDRIIETISDEVRDKATDRTLAGTVLFTGGIKLKIDDSQLIKSIIENYAPKLVKMHVTPQMLEQHNSQSYTFANKVKAEAPKIPWR